MVHSYGPRFAGSKAETARWKGLGGGKMLISWQTGSRESGEELEGDTPFQVTLQLTHLQMAPPPKSKSGIVPL